MEEGFESSEFEDISVWLAENDIKVQAVVGTFTVLVMLPIEIWTVLSPYETSFRFVEFVSEDTSSQELQDLAA